MGVGRLASLSSSLSGPGSESLSIGVRGGVGEQRSVVHSCGVHGTEEVGLVIRSHCRDDQEKTRVPSRPSLAAQCSQPA